MLHIYMFEYVYNTFIYIHICDGDQYTGFYNGVEVLSDVPNKGRRISNETTSLMSYKGIRAEQV